MKNAIQDRLEAAKESDNPHSKLIHLNAALDLIIMKMGVDNEVIDSNFSYKVNEILSHEKFPELFKELYYNLESQILRGIHGEDIIKSFKLDDEFENIELKKVKDIQDNIDGLIEDVEAFFQNISD